MNLNFQKKISSRNGKVKNTKESQPSIHKMSKKNILFIPSFFRSFFRFLDGVDLTVQLAWLFSSTLKCDSTRSVSNQVGCSLSQLSILLEK